MARSINKVNAVLVFFSALVCVYVRVSLRNVGRRPESRCRGGSNRNSPFSFLFHPIHNGVAFVNFSDFMRNTRVKKHALGYRCFSGIYVRDNSNIAGFFYGILAGHAKL